jgi:AraC family transcriptional regulator
VNTVESLNAVIDYVEKHITEKLDLNYLAGIACRSLYDFQRLFSFITEMSIAEYIRKRRLTLAGLDIKHNEVTVTEAALKYGYESPVSFARAFQAFHGVIPSEAKKSNISLKTFPRLIFQIIVKEVSQVIRTDKITVNGKEYEASYFGEQNMSSWSETYTKRKFWRLENAYDDLKDKEKTNDVLPYHNYPMPIETEQVFVIDYTKKDGSIQRKHYLSDGTVWQDMPSTVDLRLE